MKLPRRRFLHLTAGAAALPAVSRFAWAQAYPTRPVRIIEGFGAGSALDIVARLSRMLRNQHWGCVSSAWCVCRPHPQRRQPRRPAGCAVEQVRTGHQSPDGQDARPHRAGQAARDRRRGDRMTGRSPRAGGSSQERPRLAGKEPGAYRGATTMFVHFRETPYGLAMSLVENRRENGRICHEHVA